MSAVPWDVILANGGIGAAVSVLLLLRGFTVVSKLADGMQAQAKAMTQLAVSVEGLRSERNGAVRP